MYQLSSQQQQLLTTTLGTLLKEKMHLQQELRLQQERNHANDEQLYLELLEVLDALESLTQHVNQRVDEKADLNLPFVKRLPKTLLSLQRQLLNILARRQVQPIELAMDQLPLEMCQVVDYEAQSGRAAGTIVAIVRKGYQRGSHILRPVEVVVAQGGP